MIFLQERLKRACWDRGYRADDRSLPAAVAVHYLWEERGGCLYTGRRHIISPLSSFSGRMGTGTVAPFVADLIGYGRQSEALRFKAARA